MKIYQSIKHAYPDRMYNFYIRHLSGGVTVQDCDKKTVPGFLITRDSCGYYDKLVFSV